MKFDVLHPARQIIMIIERIYKYGMTTTSGGNLSIIDDAGDIWITPASIDKGTLSERDIVRVKPDGTVIGLHKPSSELPFHRSIYQKRSDIRAVLHAHPPSLVAFSLVHKIPDTGLIPNMHFVCGDIRVAPYGLPGSIELGEMVSEEFVGGIYTVVMENHGVVCGATDLFRAFMSFETLDFCARLEINGRRLGKIKTLSEKNIKLSAQKQNAELEEFTALEYSSEQRRLRFEMCEMIRRAYDQQLFTSTQGTFSHRLSDGSFLITPYFADRKYLAPEDIIWIKDGKKEKGSNPSRSVILHKEIYERQEHINSIIIAHPPASMAFAVTDAQFDSRTIPESYILLRHIPKLPFGSSFMQPVMTADVFKPNTPIAMMENDCVIVTGSSLLNAFDRLEVLEYSARAIISCGVLGELVRIGEPEVREIEVAFNLPE